MKLVSINVGMPKKVLYNGREIETGIYKEPADMPIMLKKTNFEGDGQADLKNHGGEDKAVCAYFYDHYSYWEKQLGIKLLPGAFGENLTISGMTEKEVCIGDIFRLGEVELEVSQPRQPCFKLALKHEVKDLPVQVQNTRYTGFYFRVKKEGVIRKGDVLERISGHPQKVTVEFVNKIKYEDKFNAEAIKEILEVKELSGSFRSSFEKRL
ncbi:MOSC domain-containing protein [Metabacillus indicus]|uniref:MOSC domain-containing protein n=1 Tax=Metabacillus indicus TaxID=246786 RepID=UPI00248F621F|nr:MOSC domain-containing protein [Metabacillus indicus]